MGAKQLTIPDDAALVLAEGIFAIEALPLARSAMIALMIFSARRDVMGAFRVHPLLLVLAGLGAALVLGLNFVLLADAFGVPIPFGAG